MSCPFYGKSLTVFGLHDPPGGASGNRCGLITEAHSPCAMEITGQGIDWDHCPRNPEVAEILEALSGPPPFPPIEEGHPALGAPCMACGEVFKVGDILTLIAIGPGGDPDARRAAREGEPFEPVNLTVHWACATGGDEEELLRIIKRQQEQGQGTEDAR